MTSRVQREPDAPVLNLLPIVQALQRDVAQPRPHHAFCATRDQIVAMSAPGVVGMGMGNDRPINRSPGVEVEVARRAIQTLRPTHDQIIAVAHG
jgi:hypothetical protein